MKTDKIYYELTASTFDWEIGEGKIIEAWGFNKQLPGPMIKAKKGDTVVIKVKNELQEPTIIHWHGIRLPALMDGTGEVQKPIQPGDTFEYSFEVPDAGTFWYHSHYNETVQMERGMYGALIVEEDETTVVTDNDRVFMIDDMKLDKKNNFTEGNLVSRWIERHDGRQGDTLLLNGKENTLINMNEGQTERWRFINSSSARYFILYLDGKTFRIIGTDGGLLEKPQNVQEILLTPGERIDILVGPFYDGESFSIDSLMYNRTTILKAKRENFAKVVVGSKKPSISHIPEVLRKIEPLANADAEVTRKITLSVDPSIKNLIDFQINGGMHTNDKPVYVGELQVWEIANSSLMDHPFHLHGYFFQVLEENGKVPEYRSWKDTVNIQPRSKVKIAWIPDNRPGMWMYHCHIIEHHAAGMMANFEVVDPSKGEQFAHQPHSCTM